MRREMMKEGYEYERMNNDKNDICKEWESYSISIDWE